jgi:hypothetical protein
MGINELGGSLLARSSVVSYPEKREGGIARINSR